MYKKVSGRQSPTYSPLLSKALHRFQSELKTDDQFVLDNVVSVEELLSQTRALQPPAPQGSKISNSFSRLEPILTHLNDFAAIIAVCSGADARAAGLVWGSLRVILTLASPTSETLADVLDMLDELSLSLPRFRYYEENLPMTKALESALLDVYTEVTCFCARTINFFRSNPHRQLIRFGWPKMNDDFKKTINRLKKLSRAVDKEAEAIRLRSDTEKNTELLAAMDLIIDGKGWKEKLPCFYVPLGRDEQFYGRDDVLARLRNALDPINGDPRPRAFALHGMGGVGKTKIALQYVNSSRSKFDAILWISADNSIKLTQSFLEVSRRLGLSPENDDAHDAVAAMSKVKSWLTETSCRWLLVLDNADDADIIVGAWPSGAVGSVLITSRDSAAWFGTAAESCKVQPFNDETGVSAFLGLVGRDKYTESERTAATRLMQALGGLPLAINQISGFIVQQRLALDNFLPLYERNSAKIDAKKFVRDDYEHTLSTVWELALSQLSGPSRTLQTMLAFLDPDKVHESILCEAGEYLNEGDFEFLGDEMDFLDAKEALLRAALIDRSSEDATLSVHRLIQAAVMKRLSSQEKAKYFDQIILLLSNGFPNTWNTVTSHQFSAWEKCEKCLPHVDFLIAQSKKYSLQATDSKMFAELIFRCCWYLYEREHYIEARRFMRTALAILGENDSLMFASASMLQGLIELDTNNIPTALDSFLTALKIRKNAFGPDDALIASSLNAISLAYTEMGDLDKAVSAGQKAIDIRLRTNSDRIGNSYSNMASTLLRMGKADEAEEMLKRCPSLKDFTDDTFLNTGNPRFSGDMVLLARIRQRQNRLDDALRLASKALSFRQRLLGNRLKTLDSLYQVAVLLQQRGDRDSAINLLEESIEILEHLPDAEGYRARAEFRLAGLYREIGSGERSQFYMSAAEARRVRLAGGGEVESACEEVYDKLVLWILW